MSKQNTLMRPDPRSSPDAPGAAATRAGRVRLAGYGVGIALVVWVALLGIRLFQAWRGAPAAPSEASQPSQGKAPASWQRPVVSSDGLVDNSGVRLVQVAVTGGGGLIDLRYQVVDPDKAAAVHGTDTPPLLIEKTTGLIVDQLLMGHSHTGQYQAGVTYYLIFENPGNLVQPGSKVSILLGNSEVDDVTVQ